MRKRFLTCIVLFGAVIAPAQSPAPQVVKYINGKWFDGHGYATRTYYSVAGILHSNSPGGTQETVDLGGGYVVPACGEAHNHNAAQSNQHALREYADNGILYVENPENLPEERTANALLNGEKGPDVIFANGAFTAPGGHPIGLVKRNVERGVMTDAQGEGAFYYSVSSRAELDKKFPQLLSTRPDFVKLMLVYSEEFEKREADDKYFSRKGLNPKLVEPIIQRAHAAGLRAMVHVESGHDFSVAVRAGADQVVHLPGFWPDDETVKGGSTAKYEISDADARLAAKKKVVVITTVGEALAKADQMPDPAGKQIVAVLRRNLELLRRYHVRVVIGSDQYRKDSRFEAQQLVQHGIFDPLSMLTAWCSLTPQAIFPRRHIGRLADGYEANFRVMAVDPLTDANALTATPRLVFKAGKRIASSPKALAGHNIEELAWLAGTWHLDTNGKRIEEHWTTPAGGMMLGLGRTLAKGKTVKFEFLRIEQRTDGLVYVAQPGGQPPTEFRLANSEGDEWVFENLQHDFPKRIRYRRTGADSLTARVEDESGAKHVDFLYRRAK